MTAMKRRSCFHSKSESTQNTIQRWDRNRKKNIKTRNEMNDILLPHRNSGSEILGSQTKEFMMKVFLLSSLTFIFW